MTDSLDLTEISGSHTADDGARRDRWDRYLIVPPEGGQPVPYRRATTVVKALDSGGSLVPWSQSRVLRGVVVAPDLLRRLRKLLRASGDPWYDTPALKSEFRKLVGELADAGGASEKRDRGTWLHGCAQRHLLDLPQLPQFNAADEDWLADLLATLDDHGIEIDPTYVETLVVHDRLRIAGRADYLRCWVKGYEQPLVADLKTGDSLDYALSGFVMQLAVYASADNVYVQGLPADGSHDERQPMPERDTSHALVIHAPQDGSGNSVWVLDLAAGMEAFELALAVERWRKRDGIAWPHVPPLTELLQKSIDAVQRQRLRDWLQQRIDAIGQNPHARRALAYGWPPDLVTLRASGEHTDDDLARIESLCVEVEREHGLPFGPNRPTTPDDDPAANVVALFPGSELLSGSQLPNSKEPT